MNGAANIGNVANRIAMAIMAAGLAWCLFGFIAPGSAQSAPDSTAVVVYTVQPGDTLWRYAASITPEGGNVGDTVDELMRLNNLDTVSLHAGQRLIVPHEVGAAKRGLFQGLSLFWTTCIARFARIQTPRWSIPVLATMVTPSVAGANVRNAPSDSPHWRRPCYWS